jgi:hypothetical protein
MVDREIEIRGEVMLKRLLLSLLLVGVPLYPASVAFAQIGPPANQRITEQLIINGQQVSGAMVTENGVVQSYTCQSPQPYITMNQSSSGWACFDQATGTWLMNAQPPVQQQSSTVYSEPPATVYTEPSTAYGYYPDSYPYPYGYPYYPYSYSPFFYGAPLFGFGFGFGNGFHNHGHFDNGHFGHGFAGRGFAHGPVVHGPVGHGSFGHGSFGHGFAGGHGAMGHGSFGGHGGGFGGHMGGGFGGHMGGGHR